jgi:hypothetical protein
MNSDTFKAGILKVTMKVRGYEVPPEWSEFLREEEQFWNKFSWVPIVGANRNTDQVPDYFNVDFLCPECKSVWIELDAFGCTASRAPRAARLVCATGHRIEWDRHTTRSRLTPFRLSTPRVPDHDVAETKPEK